MKSWKIISLSMALALGATAVQASDVGKPARNFTLTTLNGHTVHLADLKGKVVVLNRWATWCTPCKAEMVTFENYMRTHPNSDLAIYAVTVELQAPPSKLKPLQGVLHYDLATHISSWGYGVLDGVPTSYVIDRAGVLRYADSGAFDDRSFEKFITPLLAESAPGVQVASAKP
jgi:thiol-disulfide isomerase/thioredoxin